MHQQEYAAAQSRTLRFDQPEDGMGRNGGIDGVAPASKHRRGRIDGVGVGRRYHAAVRPRVTLRLCGRGAACRSRLGVGYAAAGGE
ncbi:MAG: hypothetical protein U5K38_16185 [Woeseiaceae bacterium]|nr:hypothetical protein [Woeseiaceae bacterium]